MTTVYRSVQAHGDIEKVFSNVFWVTGTNGTHHDGIHIQSSRNMVIVKQNDEITLINTVRLNQEGLKALDGLGKVKNIIRIGAFHGYDDAFYVDHHNAKLWVAQGMQAQYENEKVYPLSNNDTMPLENCSVITFEKTAHPEAMLLLKTESGNVLITCDVIQNWTQMDPFFSTSTYEMFYKQGMIAEANIPDTWIHACKPTKEELKKITQLEFSHLISAHGEPLLNDAYEKVCKTLHKKFDISV